MRHARSLRLSRTRRPGRGGRLHAQLLLRQRDSGLRGPPAPVSAPVAYSYGEVCEVPTRVAGGTVVAEGSAQAKPIVTVRQPPSRVVISEPTGRRSGSTRVGWRGRDELEGATTQISGAYEEEGVVR